MLWLSVVNQDFILVLLIVQELSHQSLMLSDLRNGCLLLSLKTPAKRSLMTLIGRVFVRKLVYDVILVRCADLVVDVL